MPVLACSRRVRCRYAIGIGLAIDTIAAAAATSNA